MKRRLAWYVGSALALLFLMAPAVWSQFEEPPIVGKPVFPKFATLYSAPLVNTAVLGPSQSAMACSVLNLGTKPVRVSINLCDANGSCNVVAFGCNDTTLQPGHVCDSSHIAIAPDQAAYCRVDASSYGQIQLRGSFQLMNGGDVSAATEVR